MARQFYDKRRQALYPSQCRGGMTRLSALACLSLLLLVSSGIAAMAQVNVYTRSYDTARTGANLQETILTPANVNPTSFGKLFTVPTDGQVFAQPLYVSGLAINGGTHNVVFVASMLNTVYAIDADNGTVLWHQNFGTPITPKDVENDQNISWSTGIGILGTPVIDPGTNIMYFVSGYQNGSTYAYRLNAIEIATGLPVSGSPTTITATYSTADLTNPLVFNPKMQNQRTGLALANGNVYFGFGSHEDQQPYHGWVMAYSTSTLAQTAVYADTTLGSEGGIWNAGQAPVVDSSGNLYMSTGNGSFGTTPNNLVQTGNSMIKLSPSLELLDYFTPNNSATLNAGDMDLGSSGLMLVPNTSYLLGGGKQGVLYLVDTGGMGGFNSSGDKVHQEFQAIYGKGTSHIHGTPAYFDSDANGPTTFVWGENDVLHGFVFNPTTGLLTSTPFASSTMTAPVTNNNGAMPGGFVSISANGTTNGIVWASTPYNGNANALVLQGVLYAFDADTLNPLWSDKTNDARDEIGFFSKYCPPLVANGKVYVPNFGPLGTTNGSGSLVVYGLLPKQQNVLTVTANNAARGYDKANPAFSGTVTGAVNGDTFTESFTTAATTTSNVGSYPIVPSVTGANLSNYTVNVVDGTLKVTAAATSTALSAPSSVDHGATVKLTATVKSSAGTPAGSVTFKNGSTSLGNGALNGSGVATLSTTALPAGVDSVTSTYAAAGNFAASTSPATKITVKGVTQTITFPVIANRPYGSPPFTVKASSSAGSSYPVTITVESGPAVISGDKVTLTGAGTIVLKAEQAGNSKYAPASATRSFVSTHPTLTIEANNATRAAGVANPKFTGKVTGAVNGDKFTESFSTTAKTSSKAGKYPIVPSVAGTKLSDYIVTKVNGTLTVTAAK
jgi:MBG domain (YGX type)/Bacterial Ig-like domain (group 3)/PQQ enzyme repeat